MFNNLTYAHLPEEAELLRSPVKALIAETINGLSIEQRTHSWAGYDIAFSRALGQAGYLGLTLPVEYGGGGKGPFARFVVIEELLAVGAPVAAHWIGDRQSALQILKFGSEEQRRHYLPNIARGDYFFCIGMSEPGSGSDLASVRSRAERVEGGWKLNGQKIWTTMAHISDYMIALVRTSGTSEDKHSGLSQLIIDLKAPGVTVRPIPDLTGDEHFAEVFFEDVLLPETAIIGQEGDGWAQVTAELAFERSGPERIYSSIVLLDGWISHLCSAGHIDSERERLVGKLTAQLATLRAMSIAVTAQLAEGHSPVVEASLIKDLGTAFEQSIPTLIADDLGSRPDEPVSADLHRALIYCSRAAPTYSLRGGTREILRGIISRGLGVR
tara:strand:- start:2801 stop:3952 length:1152 start_codon:yes stop_codon:yes gene_type:complete